jgi:hypothetical protein
LQRGLGRRQKWSRSCGLIMGSIWLVTVE